MKIEKYSPKWLLEKINASKTDAHKLMHIIEYRKELVESTEKQFAIHNVVGRSEQLPDENLYQPCEGCTTSCKSWEVFFCKKLVG